MSYILLLINQFIIFMMIIIFMMNHKEVRAFSFGLLQQLVVLSFAPLGDLVELVPASVAEVVDHPLVLGEEGRDGLVVDLLRKVYLGVQAGHCEGHSEYGVEKAPHDPQKQRGDHFADGKHHPVR